MRHGVRHHIVPLFARADDKVGLVLELDASDIETNDSGIAVSVREYHIGPSAEQKPFLSFLHKAKKFLEILGRIH